MATNSNTTKLNPFLSERRLSMSWLNVAALILIVVLFYWFVVKPKSAQLKTVQDNLTQLNNSYQTIQNEKDELNGLITKLQSSKDEIKELDEAIPLKDRSTRLYVLVDNLVSQTGMKLANLSVELADQAAASADPTGAKKGQIVAGDKKTLADPYGVARKLQTYTISIASTGNVTQFKSLLELLETNGRILDVTNLEINRGDDGITTFRIKVLGYAYTP